VLEEMANDGWPGVEMAEALPGERGEGADRWRERVGPAPLAPGVRLLLGGELRCVRRQVSERVVAATNCITARERWAFRRSQMTKSGLPSLRRKYGSARSTALVVTASG